MVEGYLSDFDASLDYNDPKQSKKGKEPTAAEQRKSYLTDLNALAKTPEGIRVICFWLEALGTFEPSWTEKNARLARSVVLKDFGSGMLDDVAIVSEEAHNNIQRAMRVRRKLAEELRT